MSSITGFLFGSLILVAMFYAIRRFAYIPAKIWLGGRGFELTPAKTIIAMVAVSVLISVLGNLKFFAGTDGFLAMSASTILIGWIWYYFFRTGAGRTDDVHQRGGMVVGVAALAKMSLAVDKTPDLFVGKIGIPKAAEARHFLLAGAPGSGKSQAFYQLVEAARKRGDGGICADVNAEMFGRFYDAARDILLNPLDSRTVNWSPLAEIFGLWDCDRIAKSIIPDGEGSSQEWNHYAQVLLSAVLASVWQADRKNYELTNLLLTASNEDLSEALKHSAAAQLFAPGAERMLSSIRAITATYCKPLSYLNPGVGRDGFSITKFIKTEAETKRGAWLFMPTRDDFFKSIRTLVAAQVDIAISALLSTQDDEHRRVWFVIDEFATWGKVTSILDLLTKSRKKGGVGALGLQTISQIRESYGQHNSQTILASLGNWVTLRAGDAETSEYMSKAIGDEQVRRTNESVNADNKATTSEQIAQQRTVMPAELQNLPDLQGILNISGSLPAGWVTIPISKLPRKNEAFKITQS